MCLLQPPGYPKRDKRESLPNWMDVKVDITKTCLYNFDPLKPHFYIVKLGFTGVYIIFLISAQKHRLWYSLEPPRRGGANEYPKSMFWAEIWKISQFFTWKISVFGGEIFYIFEQACFRNVFADHTGLIEDLVVRLLKWFVPDLTHLL